jgi:hypothetical protein
LTLEGKLMSVPVVPDASGPGTIEFGAPVEQFQSPLARPLPTIDQYSVTRDGQRFLFIQPRRDQASSTPPITVVVNWQAGLRK